MSEERKAAERLAVKGLGAILLIVAAVWGIPQIWDKLSPFIIAIPLAAVLQPVVQFSHERFKMKRGFSVLVCVLLILGAIFWMIYWAVTIVSEQAPALVGQSGNLISESVNTLQQAAERLMNDASSNMSPQVRELMRGSMSNAIQRVSDWGSQIAADVVAFTVNMVTSLPYVTIYVSFLAMALYFISIHYENIRSYLPGGKRRRQDSNTTQLTNSALRSLMGYLKVQGTFAAMVLIVSMVALNIMKFKYASALAIIAALMELIPMIGSGLMYIVMGIAYLLTGNTLAGVQVLVLTGVLQLLRRLLEPKLMSNSIGISPLMSLIGMFVGLRVGGIIGLIGGPVAMSVLVGAVRGDVFKSINDDLFLVVQWFKRRWAREVPAAALIQGTAAQQEEGNPPGTAAQEEITGGTPAGDNSVPEESAAEGGGQEHSGE